MEFKDSFEEVESASCLKLLEVLRQRIPRSGHIYNSALLWQKCTFQDELKCYSLNGDLSEDAILMMIFNREDYGQDINISLPEQNFQVTDEIRDAFTSTKKIRWTEGYMFSATDRRISYMLFEISTLVYRNSVTFNPNYYYWMSPENVKQLTTQDDNGVQVKPMNVTPGVTFLTENWKYTTKGTDKYFSKLIDKHISAGVFENDEIVCGAVITGQGMIGVLNTNPAHRNKGHAVRCMKYLIKEMDKQGMVPISTAQQENEKSLAMHSKVGMDILVECDYVFHMPY